MYVPIIALVFWFSRCDAVRRQLDAVHGGHPALLRRHARAVSALQRSGVRLAAEGGGARREDADAAHALYQAVLRRREEKAIGLARRLLAPRTPDAGSGTDRAIEYTRRCRRSLRATRGFRSSPFSPVRVAFRFCVARQFLLLGAAQQLSHRAHDARPARARPSPTPAPARRSAT